MATVKKIPNKLTQEQVMAIAAQLAGLAAIFNPAAAGSISALVGIGTQLATMINAVRTNDPELWAKVTADFDAAKAGFEASVAAQHGEG
jgi:Pyruvate/2-oxoacid:ferredoxin oxidoreductase gamma subunit